MNTKYVKLVDRGSIYQDLATNVNIVGDRVAKVPVNERLAMAIRVNRLKEVSEEEYEAYLESLKSKDSVAPSVESPLEDTDNGLLLAPSSDAPVVPSSDALAEANVPVPAKVDKK